MRAAVKFLAVPVPFNLPEDASAMIVTTEGSRVLNYLHVIHNQESKN